VIVCISASLDALCWLSKHVCMLGTVIEIGIDPV
jgi:hypothetical protein